MFDFTGFDHIVLCVDEVERALAFYHDLLGMPTERLEAFRNGEAPFPSVRIGKEAVIDLFPPELHGMWQEGRVRGEGFFRNMHHYCMTVEDEDVEALVKHLEANGVKVNRGPSPMWGAQGIGISFYFNDPDGNELEIRSYKAPGIISEEEYKEYNKRYMEMQRAQASR